MTTPLAVLLVEDVDSDAQLLVRLLKKAGYAITFQVVETAAHMRAALEQATWDIVISDYSLPQFDGPAALRLLQETGLDIPFIAVSGTMGEETAVTMMKNGAHDYLMKGNLTRLAPAVERELRDAATRRERKRAEHRQALSVEIQGILNHPLALRAMISAVLSAIKSATGFDAVGIRLQNGDDFPYFAQLGFSNDFLLAENILVVHAMEGSVCCDKEGKPCLHCTCGLVISGQTDPGNPLCTPGGSFWTNNSFPLADLPADLDPRLQPRNRCMHDGYGSVALIPIRANQKIVGLLQLNHRKKDSLTLEMIRFFEGICATVGMVLMQKSAEAEREEALARLRKIASQVPGVVYQFRLRPDGTMCMPYASDGIREMYRVSPEEIREDASGLFASHHPDDNDAIVASIRKSARELTLWIHEYRIKFADGTERWLFGNALPQREVDGATLWHGFVTDITARKQAEAEKATLESQLRQSQKMESVGRLAGGVAHDFNNILQAILGSAELAIAQTAAADPIRGDLEEIQGAAQRAAALTRQLLAFARKQVIAPRMLDVNERVEGILKMLRRLIGENIELTWVAGANLWPVRMDPSQVDQILANLCVNARDAISGVGAVHVATENVHVDEPTALRHEGFLPGDYVLLTISDTGCGMDEETRSQIFEPFFTTKAEDSGTGLGLATVYGIVRQNHGHIGVHSQPGHGTTFHIHLPRHLGADAAQRVEDPLKPGPRGCETVLLVEDDPAILNLSGRMLRSLGYTVLAASTPAMAMRLAEEHAGAIQLLMTDAIMPGMHGFELAGKLKARHPQLKCLLMSGYSTGEIAHHGVPEQDFYFIAKPFSRDELTRKMREILEQP